MEVTVKSYENISIVDQNTLNLTQFESRSRVLLSIEQIKKKFEGKMSHILLYIIFYNENNSVESLNGKFF